MSEDFKITTEKTPAQAEVNVKIEEETLTAAEAHAKAKTYAEEQAKQNLKKQLIARKEDLLKELHSLKGLFAGSKRKKLQERIDELDQQLRHL